MCTQFVCLSFINASQINTRLIEVQNQIILISSKSNLIRFILMMTQTVVNVIIIIIIIRQIKQFTLLILVIFFKLMN